MSILRYQMVIVWSDKDNGYLVHLPDFPEQTYHAQGSSYAEAAKEGEAVLRSLDQPVEPSQIAIEIYPTPKETEAQQTLESGSPVDANAAAINEAALMPGFSAMQETSSASSNGTAARLPIAQSDDNSTESPADNPTEGKGPFPWLMTAFASIGTSVAAVAMLVALAYFSEGVTSRQSAASTTSSVEDAEAETDLEKETDSNLNNEVAPGPKLELANSITESSDVWAVASYSDRSRNIDLIISGTETGLITITDRESGQPVRRIDAHKDKVRDIAIAPNTRRLISSSGDGIKIWNLETGELLQSLSSPAPVWSIAIAPDESRFISGDSDGNITAWDLETGNSLYSVGVASVVWSVAIAPDGESFVSGDSASTIRQWKLETGAPVRTFSGHQSDVRAVAITPDGKTLASGSWDKTIKVWSLETGELQATLEGHRDRVVSLAINGNGDTLASGSVDTTVKLWYLPNYQLVDSLEAQDDWVLSVAFTKDQMLLAGGKDDAVKVWQ